jgi:hypothetical protein
MAGGPVSAAAGNEMGAPEIGFKIFPAEILRRLNSLPTLRFSPPLPAAAADFCL